MVLKSAQGEGEILEEKEMDWAQGGNEGRRREMTRKK